MTMIPTLFRGLTKGPILPFIGYVVHHQTAHLVSLKLRFFDAEYTKDYRELLELRAKVDDSTAGTSEHVEARREFRNHLDAMIERIKNDPDYENLDHCDLESLRHVLLVGFDKESGWRELAVTLDVNWVSLKLRFFDAEYTKDYRELLELRAKVDDSTAGTSEHDEALRALQNHLDAMIERIKNDPDYKNLMRDWDCCDIVELMQRLGGSAYKGPAEKCDGDLDESIPRTSEEEQVGELLKQAAIEDAELMEHLELMREGNLTFPELEQLFQETLPIDVPSIVLPDLLPRYRTTDTSVAKLGSSFIEGYEDRIAEALVPETGTAPSTSSLVPGTADIIDGDLFDGDPFNADLLFA